MPRKYNDQKEEEQTDRQAKLPVFYDYLHKKCVASPNETKVGTPYTNIDL